MIEDFIKNYFNHPKTYDEMFLNSDNYRNHYSNFINNFSKESLENLNKKEELAKKLFMSQGITFTVYDSGEGIEKIFPFDIIPRIITSTEWNFIEKGIKQRLKALNLFLKDVYSNQFIIKDQIVPINVIYSCPHFFKRDAQCECIT
jgi:uncharacterized circularly permuted ATP-grasp superfamily protein